MDTDPGKVETNWAWFVLIGAFGANFLAGGISYSFGIFYMDFLDRLETHRSETLAIGAISFACFCFIVPFAQAVTPKLGYRLVTIMGSLLAAIGLLISGFVPTLHYYYVTLGMFLGGGSGMVFIASFAALRDYFDPPFRQLMATTVALYGIPIGMAVFAPLNRVLLDNFSYAGTFIILSAIMLNGIICGLLFRPKLDLNGKMVDINNSTDSYERMKDAPDGGESSPSDENDHAPRTGEEDNDKETDKIRNTRRNYHSFEQPEEVIEVPISTAVFSFPTRLINESFDEYEVEEDENPEVPTPPQNEATPEKPHFETSAPSPAVNDDDKRPDVIVGPLLFVLFGISDRSTLCSWRLIVFIIVSFLFSMGFTIPLFVYPDEFRKNGSSDHTAAWILTAMGLAFVVGIVANAHTAYKLSPTYGRIHVVLLSCCLMVCGLIISLVHYYIAFAGLFISVLVYGILSACFMTLKETILRQALGPNNANNAAGLIYMISGVGFLLGPPIAGHLCDTYATYTWSFVLGGTCMAASGMAALPLLITRGDTEYNVN